MFEVVIEAWNTLYNNGPNPQTQEHGECSVLSVNPQYAALESTELRIKSLLGFKKVENLNWSMCVTVNVMSFVYWKHIKHFRPRILTSADQMQPGVYCVVSV